MLNKHPSSPSVLSIKTALQRNVHKFYAQRKHILSSPLNLKRDLGGSQLYGVKIHPANVSVTR